MRSVRGSAYFFRFVPARQVHGPHAPLPFRERRCAAPRNGGHIGKGRFDDPGLLLVVDVERTLGRARPVWSTDVRDRILTGSQFAQAGLDEAAGAHIARFFLQPDDLPHVRIVGQGRADGGVLERR